MSAPIINQYLYIVDNPISRTRKEGITYLISAVTLLYILLVLAIFLIIDLKKNRVQSSVEVAPVSDALIKEIGNPVTRIRYRKNLDSRFSVRYRLRLFRNFFAMHLYKIIEILFVNFFQYVSTSPL